MTKIHTSQIKQPVVTDATTARTLALTDAGGILLFTSDDPVSLSIPSDSVVDLGVGFPIFVIQKGDGVVTVSGSGSVVINSSVLVTSGADTALVLIKVGANEWDVFSGAALQDVLAYWDASSAGQDGAFTLSGDDYEHITFDPDPAEYGGILGAISRSRGKYYFEILVSEVIAGTAFFAGVAEAGIDTGAQSLHAGSSPQDYLLYRGNGDILKSVIATYTDEGEFATYTDDDVLGFAVDFDEGRVRTYKNGTLQKVSSFSSGATLLPFWYGDDSTLQEAELRLVSAEFTETIPSGYSEWGVDVEEAESVVAPSGIATSSNTRGKVSLANSWGARIACDGSVATWGYDAASWDVQSPPAGNDFVQLSIGLYWGIALKNNGDAVVWGKDSRLVYYGGAEIVYQSPPDDMDIRTVASLRGEPYFYCLLPDGSIYSWDAKAGDVVADSDLIPDAGEYIAIATGFYYGVGILSGGTVSVWASPENEHYSDLLDIPVEATDIIEVACGAYHILALKSDGSVITWGNDIYDALDPPVFASNVVSISCSSLTSFAVLENGSIVSWGSNAHGEAAHPSSLLDAVRVFPSSNTTIFAARSDSSIVGWGGNDNRQVTGAQGKKLFCAATEGTVIPPNPDPSPDLVPPPEPAPVFTLPLAKNPVVYADAAMFGLHYNGRILLWGRESSITRNTPVFLRKAHTDMTVVFDGISYAVLVLQTNGRLAGWGTDSGTFEKLKSPFVDNGNRALFDYASAKKVVALPSAIYKYITVVLEDGTVDCKYLSYAVGSPPAPRPKPSLIYRPPAPSSGGPAVDDNPYLPSAGLPISNAIQVSCTNDMCFALGSDGVVHGWGPASLGAYYLSPLTSYTEQTGSVGAPGQYSRGLSDIVKIDSQFGLVVALDDSGEVTVWGKPDMQYWVPQPGTLPTIVDVAAGKHHIVALGDDGVIYCWGNNKVGQCNVPAGLGRVNRIRASDYQSIAILDSGEVVVWGAFPAYTQKSINQINFYQ